LRCFATKLPKKKGKLCGLFGKKALGREGVQGGVARITTSRKAIKKKETQEEKKIKTKRIIKHKSCCRVRRESGNYTHLHVQCQEQNYKTNGKKLQKKPPLATRFAVHREGVLAGPP